MTTRLVFVSVVVVLTLVAGAAWAQAPQRQLTDGDVARFVRDFKTLAGELDRLGEEIAPDLENAAGFAGMLGAMRANTEVQKVLAKYGWGEVTFQKFSAILMSYFVIKLEDGFKEAAPEVAAAMAEIDRNPQMTADQKAALKAQMGMVTQQLEQMQAAYKAQVHPDDIATVRARTADLDAVFEE